MNGDPPFQSIKSLCLPQYVFVGRKFLEHMERPISIQKPEISNNFFIYILYAKIYIREESKNLINEI